MYEHKTIPQRLSAIEEAQGALMDVVTPLGETVALIAARLDVIEKELKAKAKP